MTTELKVCTVCGKALPAAQTHFYAGKKPGTLRGRCKVCEIAGQMANYRRKNPTRTYAPAAAKACTKCGVAKELGAFPASKRMRDGRCSWCRACHSAADAARKARMTPEQKRRRSQRAWAKRKAALLERRTRSGAPDLRIDTEARSKTLELIGHVPYGVAGIYSITNRDTGRTYVGSSLCVRGRWGTHVWRLQRGKHHSRRLQGAWDRDGQNRFAFSLLERVTDVRHLLVVEQAWINFLHAYAPRGGYNTSPNAQNTQGVKKTPEQIEQHRQMMYRSARPYFVRHPDGRTEIAANIGLFAKAHGLAASSLRRVGAGLQPEHKGYWCRKATEEECRSVLA